MIEQEETTVASPCIYICEMDEASGFCRGCFRTLEEITDWSRAGEDERLAILAAIARRRGGNDPAGEEAAANDD